MKRRVISLIIVLAMCLSLCPTRTLAADWEPDASLCPHHRVHTDECGYVPPTPGRDCTHEHDEGCFIAETLCIHQHTEDCYPEAEPSLCAHECSEASGCVIMTPSCPHTHDEFCGYVPEDAGAPCMFACRLCPIEALLDKLPLSVTPDNRPQVEDQLNAILDLYTGLTGDEQDQLDLSRCFALQAQLDATNVPMLLAYDIPDFEEDRYDDLKGNIETSTKYIVWGDSLLYDTHEYSRTATQTSVFLVESTLCLMGSGTVASKEGAGIEVAAGGKLYIEDSRLTVIGSTYALDIASGATVQLSGGKYIGDPAIRTADGDFSKLLKKGYDYFDDSGKPITDMTTAKTVIVQVQPTVEWANVEWANKVCDWVIYDGSPVELKDLPDVTITDPAGDQENLRKYLTYYYKKAGDPDQAYTSTPPTDAGAYEVKVVLPAMGSYRAAEDTLTLTIKPKQMDITPPTAALDITGPTAAPLTYNRASQELVTAGVIKDAGAISEGAVIKYTTTPGGPYSTTIPTGVNAYEEYQVWYKVEDTKNYAGVTETEINNVKILPKPITAPKIEVSEPSYKYDGLLKNPKITVKDGDTVIPDSQYTITWKADSNPSGIILEDAGTYVATIKSVEKGNYTIDATATVVIKPMEQNSLRIEGAPATINYGDEVDTMYTSGGAAGGTVTWSVMPEDRATINPKTGDLTATGVGTVTVTAVKKAANYADVEATCKIKINPKPVTAVVTVASKEYDGSTAVASNQITVTVNGVLDDDNLSVDNLTGNYSDANVGTNKPVTLNSSSATVTGNTTKYTITYPTTATGDITPKEVSPTVTLSGDGLQEDASPTPQYYYNYDGKEKRPTVTVKDGSTVIPSSNYTVSYSNNTSVGTATVTVTANPDGNYTFAKAEVEFAIREAQAELTSPPRAKNLTYTGEPQELVTEGAGTGGKVVYSLTTKSSDYKETIPVGKEAKTYTVYCKVTGDGNHADSTVYEVSVTIKPKEITPIITLSPNSYTYGGTACKPTVTVKDGSTTISTSEYTTSYSDNISVGTATVTINNANGGNYIVNGTKTFEIKKANPTVTAPTGKANLQYNAKAQELITGGSSPHGTMVYSLGGSMYSPSIPTAKDAGSYTVYYKVLGDSNHTDSAVGEVNVTISQQSVTPTIELFPSSAVYNGNVQQPTVTVRDGAGYVIPTSEYVYVYDTDTNWTDTGDYKVTVKNASDGNYVINETFKMFRITEAKQGSLSITDKPGQVYFGDAPFSLSVSGGSGDGEVKWSSDKPNIASIDDNGLVTINAAGEVTITATKASPNYLESTASYTFKVLQKSVEVTVTVSPETYVYTGSAIKPSVTVKTRDGTALLPGDYTVNNDNNTNAGPATVIVTSTANGNYEFTPVNVDFEITKGQAVIDKFPEIVGKDERWVYNATPRTLVNGGSTKNNIGEIEYSLSENSGYSTALPTGTNAGSYTVWYQVPTNNNYEGIAPVELGTVTIAKADPTFSLPLTATAVSGQKLAQITLPDGTTNVIPGSFAWNDSTIEAEDGTSYKVTFTPNDTSNYNITTTYITVTVTSTPENPENPPTPPAMSAPSAQSTPSASPASSAPMQTSIRNNTSTTTLSAAAGDNLVKEAVASQSKNVVIKPEITGSVTKTEVSLPASTVSKLSSETNAALTVSTPVANVTIPNAALNTLSSAGGAVEVMTEQADNTVTLTLTAGGKEVGTVPGGLTLTVPVEDAGPGTVAVLVNEDGTRETIRKSVAENGELSIPLNGSATVEIVDNSKDFADVPDETWVADAVAFASAHELFSGTSETTFSPEQPMSRAMLATVLYNLEGRPAQDLTDKFSDVSSDAWYAEGVSWAAANGITNGYGDGQFGPNDNITREQFVVMLWKYAGSPAADGQALSFTDADQVSGYAEEALRWATANGILNGYDNGQLDPGGLTTRAQAAQMLKNFMENI